MTSDHLFREVARADPDFRRAVLVGLRDKKDLEKEVDVSLKQGGPLAGTLCLIKDNFDMKGFPTQASSTFLESVRPGPHSEGGLMTRLRECGVVPAGKTHMNEFAYGLDGANPHVGDCANPLDPARCSGGSSSGSATAVAKGWVPLALGTDTGGSVRVPAAYCGIYGFRLPPDPWALDGVFPLAPRYDSVGWFTSSLQEMRKVSAALLDLPSPDSEPLRIRSILPEQGRLTEAVARLFPHAEPLSLPDAWGHAEERVEHYNVLQSREAYTIHREWIDSFADEYSPAVRSLILRARSWSDRQVKDAKQFEHSFGLNCDDLFQDADLILFPVSEAPAPKRPMSKEQRSELLAQTTPGSLGRLPVLTLPVPHGNLSLGIQCMLPPTGWKPILARLLGEEFIHPLGPDASINQHFA